MTLSLEEVEHIASLARLRLTAAETELYREQLSAILDYMARLGQLDTSQIEPTATVIPLHTVLRPDVVRPSLMPEALLSNAPEAEAQMFRVPPVLGVSP
jgi:aspartyl-tRNA(Asn)/glutamyl-tRNA(Gln) amidotransferase subunit C